MAEKKKLGWKTFTTAVIAGLVAGGFSGANIADDSDAVIVLEKTISEQTMAYDQMNVTYSELKETYAGLYNEDGELIGLAEKEAEINALEGNKTILIGDVETLNEELTALKVENGKYQDQLNDIFNINMDKVWSEIEDEIYDNYDEYMGTKFSNSEITIKYKDDKELLLSNLDLDDKEATLTVSGSSIEYDDDNVEHIVGFVAKLDIEDGEIDDVEITLI